MSCHSCWFQMQKTCNFHLHGKIIIWCCALAAILFKNLCNFWHMEFITGQQEREFQESLLLKHCRIKHWMQRVLYLAHISKVHSTAEAEWQGDVFLASSTIAILLRCWPHTENCQTKHINSVHHENLSHFRKGLLGGYGLCYSSTHG